MSIIVGRSLVTDNDIVSEFKKGHTTVFSYVLDHYEARIYRLVFGMVGNTHDAQDLTQEVFIKVYEKLDTFKQTSTLYYWMCRIATNHCRNAFKKKRLLTFLSLDRIFEKNGDQFPDLSESADIEKSTEVNDDLDGLMAGLDQLPQRQRELLVLRDINELSYSEISTMLNLPIGTVKSGLSRAKTALKQIMLTKKEGHS